MRVLITTDTIGGVWTFTLELAMGLLERGCAVLLISLGRWPSRMQAQECAGLADRFGPNFRYVPLDIPLEWMEQNELAFEAGMEVILKEASAFKPDLLHSNQFCFGAIDLPVPVLITAHSDVLSWARACRNSPLPDSPWLRRYIALVQEGLDGAASVVAPTTWMLEAVSQSFRLPLERAVISNGTSIGPSFRSPRVLKAATAGRTWDEAKGISLLKHVDSPIPILVAGESQWEGAEVSAAGVPCTFLGQLSRDQMCNLFRSSAIYLCTSLYEPFGLAALEAARGGCAVLARAIPSLREVWQDGALYFDSAESLSALLHHLHRDPPFLMRARMQSFERAHSFPSSLMVDRYLSAYHSMQACSARIEHVA